MEHRREKDVWKRLEGSKNVVPRVQLEATGGTPSTSGYIMENTMVGAGAFVGLSWFEER